MWSTLYTARSCGYVPPCMLKVGLRGGRYISQVVPRFFFLHQSVPEMTTTVIPPILSTLHAVIQEEELR